MWPHSTSYALQAFLAIAQPAGQEGKFRFYLGKLEGFAKMLGRTGKVI